MDRLRWLPIPGTFVLPRRSPIPGPALFLALVLLPLTGCASSPEAAPGVKSPGAASPAATAQASPVDSSAVADTLTLEDLPLCEREATVTVRVENKSTFDIRLSFGSYRPATLASGFSRTNFQIPRHLLRYPVQLEIVRGGLQVGEPPVIQTEPVFCNIATLVIGARPEYSVFYGDELRTPKKGKVEGEKQEDEEAVPAAPAAPVEPVAAEPEPTPADSTSIEGGG